MKKSMRRFITVLLALLVSLIIGAVIMAATGTAPTEGYAQMLSGVFGSVFGFGSTLEKFVPIMLTGLAFMISARGGMFNLGVEGELYLGALAAAVTAIYLPRSLPGVVIIALSILAAMIIGALWALIPAVLKMRLSVNEVCTTILLNYVAVYFTNYMVNGPLHGGGTSPQTQPVAPQAVLPHIMPPSRANIGLFLALTILVGVWFFFRHTTEGYRIDQVGRNPLFAETMGIDPTRHTYAAMIISGAIGGLAGSIEVLGIYGLFLGNFSSNTGFDGMLAALIAGSSFFALPVVSMFIAILKVGALSMARFTSIPQSLIDTIIALFILLATFENLFSFIKKRKAVSAAEKERSS